MSRRIMSRAGNTGQDRAGKSIFAGRDVDALVDRLLSGEFPPASHRVSKAASARKEAAHA